MTAYDLHGSGPEGQLVAALRRTLAACADIVVPPCCLLCRTPLNAHHLVCGACWREVRFIRPPLCDVMGLPLPFDTGERMVSAAALARPPAYDRARAVAHFSGSIRALIHQFKYADRHDARSLFGRWLAEAGRDLLAEADVIVPVPLTRWRLLTRRFNQSAVLAQELSRQSGVAVDPHLLRRIALQEGPGGPHPRPAPAQRGGRLQRPAQPAAESHRTPRAAHRRRDHDRGNRRGLRPRAQAGRGGPRGRARPGYGHKRGNGHRVSLTDWAETARSAPGS